MEKQFISYGSVNEHGLLSLHNKQVFLEKCKSFFSKDNVELIIRERSRSFPDSLRSYYFAVVVPQIQEAFRYAGIEYSKNETDYKLRWMYLYYETVDEETGWFERDIHTLRRNDTEVTRRMMFQYIEDCIKFACTHLDWSIPFPNEELDDEDLSDKQLSIKEFRRTVQYVNP